MEGWEPWMMRWEGNCTLSGLLDGLAGSLGGVILLRSAARGWCEATYWDEHLHATAWKHIRQGLKARGVWVGGRDDTDIIFTIVSLTSVGLWGG